MSRLSPGLRSRLNVTEVRQGVGSLSAFPAQSKRPWQLSTGVRNCTAKERPDLVQVAIAMPCFLFIGFSVLCR
jgi:hypothetical protein